ncbi:hypothetical protein NLG97_g6527 [Lecanicillium saksenae]|uniref:Uncharacterized protein n=1 Tax=Lecanicillium saksenae TaxID=468837 RepID=A0ACC1QSH3_9HYPO|nr:hypothetical protein NLG97_g6527 [Lecanicillium saksenae]
MDAHFVHLILEDKYGLEKLETQNPAEYWADVKKVVLHHIIDRAYKGNPSAAAVLIAGDAATMPEFVAVTKSVQKALHETRNTPAIRHFPKFDEQLPDSFDEPELVIAGDPIFGAARGAALVLRSEFWGFRQKESPSKIQESCDEQERRNGVERESFFRVDELLLFPPEFSKKVDMQKVNLGVMKKWIASRISEILGNEDDVVIEMCFNLIEGPRYPDIKAIQIQLTGFLDKDTARFCQELWKLFLSAQDSPQGVPKELLEAKKLELMQEKVETAAKSPTDATVICPRAIKTEETDHETAGTTVVTTVKDAGMTVVDSTIAAALDLRRDRDLLMRDSAELEVDTMATATFHVVEMYPNGAEMLPRRDGDGTADRRAPFLLHHPEALVPHHGVDHVLRPRAVEEIRHDVAATSASDRGPDLAHPDEKPLDLGDREQRSVFISIGRI